MGFMKGLGEFVGGMAGKLEELQKQANLYRPEYEKKSNQELKRELQNFRENNCNYYGREKQARNLAMRQVLKDRGAL